MTRLTADQIGKIVANFIPKSIQENIFIKSLLAGATAVGILLSVPAFAPVGSVGATGWIIVYIVTGGSFSYEVIGKAWEAWKRKTEAERREADERLKRLKVALEEGDISEEEYREKVQELLKKIIG